MSQDVKDKVKGRKKAEEITQLYNRLLKYQKRLVLEGLRIAKRRGIEVKVGDVDLELPLIIVIGGSEKNINPGAIIELAKEEYPSLYKRYREGERRYFDELEKLGLRRDKKSGR